MDHCVSSVSKILRNYRPHFYQYIKRSYSLFWRFDVFTFLPGLDFNLDSCALRFVINVGESISRQRE